MGHPYAPFVHLVEKPARYLGGEVFSVRKNWDEVEARMCLAFPDVYDIGMSHLGFKILYDILNRDARTLAERAFAPWVDMERELRERNLPLVSLETARPLSEFDAVGFSLQFELTYTNVLMMLDLGGITLLSSERREDEPLVLAGGPTATHPEPIAPFLDAIVIGDGEERTTEVLLLWTALRRAGASRADRLRAIARLAGVYVPSLYETKKDEHAGLWVVLPPKQDDIPFPVRRTLVSDLNQYPFPVESPIGGPEAIFDRMSVEIARGCTEGCRFCQAGMIYRPVRERDPEQIVDAVTRAVSEMGYDEVSLTSLSTADHSCIAPLIQRVTEKLAPEHVSLGVSSLRAYGLDETVLDDMQKVRASGVTFAPEAGSQRMRDVINKNVTEAQLLETAERIFSRGWNAMKLYFMIGLPTEREEDVREIPRVGGRARAVGKRVKAEQKRGPPKVTVSVSTHVPKPHTPFQWCAMDAPDEVRKKQAWLREEARAARVDLRTHDSDTSWLEAVFARGDRRLGSVLLRAYRNGARFDSWEDQKRVDVWKRAFQDEAIDLEPFLATIPVTARLPWDHIDVGLEDGFLLREYRKALRNQLSPPCGKVSGTFVHPTHVQEHEAESRRLVCYDCGIGCDLSAMRTERLVSLRKLGAQDKRVPVQHASARKNPVPPVEVFRVRFFYEKVGPATYLSHLDLLRALPRAFRRAGLRLSYSRGFHPKPEMVFGPALSLGVMSLGEVVDVKLTEAVSPSDVISELSAGCHEGLRFRSGQKLAVGAPPISKLVTGATYVVLFAKSVLAERGGEAWLQARASELLCRVEAPVVRRIEGIGKRVDVRKYVESLEVEPRDLAEVLRRAGILGEVVGLSVHLAITGQGAAKISEVVEVLGGADLPYQAIRTSLVLRDLALSADLLATTEGGHREAEPHDRPHVTLPAIL